MLFEKLGLRPELLQAITAKGYKEATPIQEKAIPAVLSGKDVLAGAQTGTGKTAAFALPILQLLSEKREKRTKHPKALILTPTRELAAQILDFINNYGRGLSVRATVVFGGVNIRPQIMKLRRGVDILVATPGRLLDHVGQRTVDLSHVETLVLDEADQMLDMGFIHDIKRVMALVPQKRQNLLFSATYSEEIRELADSILKNPEMVEVARRNTAAETVDQVVHPVSKRQKGDLLSKLIRDGNWSQVLVFTRTKHGANKLASRLISDDVTAAAIHGNKSQGARTKALADFKRGSVRVLVATDIAARGLDISLLPYVVNYELPEVSESYVHRIGRTGRAGANGRAVSLVSPEERKELKGIQKLLKREIPVEYAEGFDKVPEITDRRKQKSNAQHMNRRRAERKASENGNQDNRENRGNRNFKKREDSASGSGENRYKKKTNWRSKSSDGNQSSSDSRRKNFRSSNSSNNSSNNRRRAQG